jgi:hypothetical protein
LKLTVMLCCINSPKPGSMCFNGAKTWQLQTNPHPTTVINGWYNSQDFITVNDTSTSPQTFEMIGVGEYYLQGDGSIDNPRKAVVLQVKDPLGNDQYITFNAAKGANLRNDEASDQVGYDIYFLFFIE